jgi:SAM-dependent methyltransferase
MQPIQYWKIREGLVAETESHYRDKITSRLQGKSSVEKVKIVTFDGVAPDITIEAVFSLLSFINKKLLPGVFKGVGVEVGAGCGFFSSLLAKIPEVDKIYSVEVSKPIVENLMPEITSTFAGGNEGKIIPCVGDFSHMNIEDTEVDFIFDFFSLHHSDDLNITFKEMARVLKPGGVIVCLDKARANSLSENDLNKLLDIEYDVDFKEFMGIDPTIKWTRRMNGEREFRLKDWFKYGEQANLKPHSFTHLARTASGNPIFRLIKTVISKLPVIAQKFINRLLGLSSRKHANQLETKDVVYFHPLRLFAKEISFFLLYER